MLRLITYLAPSIPAEFYEIVAAAIRDRSGIDVELTFETSISGPLPGDANPFADRSVDIGFVCAPTYRWMRGDLELLPVPVPVDPRVDGRPIYYADVVVAAGSPFHAFEDLRGRRWAFNDRNSKSGWFSMSEQIAPAAPHEYFSQLVQSGSHLQSLQLVAGGDADGAAIDSNVLLSEFRRDSGLPLRSIVSWGPFPIQPTVIRADVPRSMKAAVRDALLCAHEAADLTRFGFERFVDADEAAY